MARRKHFFSVRPKIFPTPTLTVTSTPTQTVTAGLTRTPVPTRTLTLTPAAGGGPGGGGPGGGGGGPGGGGSIVPTATPFWFKTTPPVVTGTSGVPNPSQPLPTSPPSTPQATRPPWPPPGPTSTIPPLPTVPNPSNPHPSPYILPALTLDYSKLTPAQKLYYQLQQWSHPGDNPYKNFVYLYLKLNKLDIPFTEQFKAKLTMRKSKSKKVTLSQNSEGKSIYHTLKKREQKIEELKAIWKLLNIG